MIDVNSASYNESYFTNGLSQLLLGHLILAQATALVAPRQPFAGFVRHIWTKASAE